MKITKTLTFSLFAALSLAMTGCNSDDGAEIDNGGNEGGGSTTGDDGNFKFEVSDISGASAYVKVSPTDKSATYYFDVVEKASFDGYNDKAAFINAYIAELQEFISENSTLGITLEDLLSKGDDDNDFVAFFEPSTDYYVFAAGVASDGTVTTEVSTFPFSTTVSQKSNNQFTITENEGYISVVPSNKSDAYIWNIIESVNLEDYSDDEFMAEDIAYLKEAGELSFFVAKGNDAYDYSDMLESGTVYTVYAYGYDGEASTALTKYEFTFTGNGSGGDEDDSTTLTGDVTMKTGDYAIAEGYGDLQKTGTNEWFLYIFNSETNEEFGAELFSDLSATAPTGRYTIDPELTYATGTAMPGMLGAGYIDGTYYGSASDGQYLDVWALAVSGMINITSMGESNFNILANIKDSKGNTVVSTYRGEIELSVIEIEALPKNFGGTIKTFRQFSSAHIMGRIAATKSAALSELKNTLHNTTDTRTTIIRNRDNAAGKMLVKHLGK